MESYDLDGRYTIDDLGRVYTDHDELWLPSVSTVLDVRETPPALANWKDRTDDYESVMQYTQNRGTVAHARCLQDLVPEDPDTGEPVVDLWSEDEESSKMQLMAAGNWERCKDDLEYIEDVWETIKLILNIDEVIDVETFVANTDVSYGGQFDLLYQDHEADETVLADLKTSKAVYEKHPIQLAAYKMAVPISVDRCEVIRMNPEKEDWQIYASDDWESDPGTLAEQFVDLRNELADVKLDTIIETIKADGADQPGIFYEPIETTTGLLRDQV